MDFRTEEALAQPQNKTKPVVNAYRCTSLDTVGLSYTFIRPQWVSQLILSDNFTKDP